MHNKKIIAAKNGDVDAAFWLLNEFRSIFRRSPYLPSSRALWPDFPQQRADEILDYLVDCFDTMFDEGDRRASRASAAEALHLIEHGKPGPKSKVSNSLQLGRTVHMRYSALLIEKPDHSEDKLIDRAIAEVALREEQKPEAVRRGYKSFLDSIS